MYRHQECSILCCQVLVWQHRLVTAEAQMLEEPMLTFSTAAEFWCWSTMMENTAAPTKFLGLRTSTLYVCQVLVMVCQYILTSQMIVFSILIGRPNWHVKQRSVLPLVGILICIGTVIGWFGIVFVTIIVACSMLYADISPLSDLRFVLLQKEREQWLREKRNLDIFFHVSLSLLLFCFLVVFHVFCSCFFWGFLYVCLSSFYVFLFCVFVCLSFYIFTFCVCLSVPPSFFIVLFVCLFISLSDFVLFFGFFCFVHMCVWLYVSLSVHKFYLFHVIQGQHNLQDTVKQAFISHKADIHINSSAFSYPLPKIS